MRKLQWLTVDIDTLVIKFNFWKNELLILLKLVYTDTSNAAAHVAVLRVAHLFTEGIFVSIKINIWFEFFEVVSMCICFLICLMSELYVFFFIVLACIFFCFFFCFWWFLGFNVVRYVMSVFFCFSFFCFSLIFWFHTLFYFGHIIPFLCVICTIFTIYTFILRISHLLLDHFTGLGKHPFWFIVVFVFFLFFFDVLFDPNTWQSIMCMRLNNFWSKV